MFGRFLAILGTSLQIVTLAAVVWFGTIVYFEAERATKTAAAHVAASKNPEELDSVYRRTTAGYVVGFVLFGGNLGAVGLLISLVAGVAMGYRAGWFYGASVVLALAYVVVVPFATVLSVVFLTHLWRRRPEYLLVTQTIP